ncbi:RNA polymerase sigma factor [Bacteroides sp. 519]|uniref:RNA polymerase sigma factor n=1 Tax=Bacteroides sp. 519 TaxID=2302937 RepID=UPI0013D64474|nr:RNA polymerase sigma factor [Bacteroides sp. 519]NDV58096.1 RNA polymerase sigma factor [Bacteroides sp. 519]
MPKISFRDNVLPLKDKLFRIALRITLNPAEAEDIVQDTMIRVWNKRNEWSELESVEAFCITITKNLAIDRIQKKEAQNISIQENMAEQFLVPGPYEDLISHEKLAIIHRLINELPEKQRTIMQLRDIEGESYKKIAQMLEVSEEQVKVYLFRARQKIRQKYNEIEKYGL